MTNIFIKTYGCAMNQADSERIHAILEDNAFKVVESELKAELIIVNSCTVKSPTIKKIKKYIEEYKEKKIVLAGCVPQAQPDYLDNVSMIGPSQIKHLIGVIEETLNGNVIKYLVEETDEKVSMPTVRKNHLIEIVPISEGCLGKPCSYCIVKKARGDLRSYPLDKIVDRVKKAITYDRVKEIWITSQDCGCYGMDIGLSIVELLRKILAIKGEFRVRLGMANPNHILPIIDDLIDVFKDEKMFKFLHIPVQSGNNRVLKSMKREYSIEDFKEIVNRFRAEFPLIAICTDIICGFPEETEQEFKDSVDLVRELKPDVLNISKFWLRPGTYAEKMEQLDNETIKNRSRLMAEIFDWVLKDVNKKWVGKSCRVLVDEKGKPGTFISKNESYRPVIMGDEVELGDFADVFISRTHYHDLFGELARK